MYVHIANSNPVMGNKKEFCVRKLALAMGISAAFLAFPAVASTASDENRTIAYVTSWGFTDADPAPILAESKVDTYLLSFARWDAQGNITSSDDIATPMPYDPWWIAGGYLGWTHMKYDHPERKILAAFGGQTYEDMWSYMDTPERREAIAQSLAELLKTPYPVYKRGLKESEIDGDCQFWNWNGSCNTDVYQKAGSVYLDGIDFDFEKVARLTEKENENLLLLAQRLRELIGKDKVISLTTYHVGADPVECANNTVVDNCSYIEDKRSDHHGEVLPLLEKSKDLFDFFNVMAYDAGPNFRWQVAMENYARAIGDKSKVVLGATINSQWGPVSNFIESKENNLARAEWQAANGYGGFFVWTFGANTQNMPLSEQVAYVNDMREAADNAAPSVELPPSGIVVSPQAVTLTLPTEYFNGNNRVVIDRQKGVLGNENLGYTQSGKAWGYRYSGALPSVLTSGITHTAEGMTEIAFPASISVGDKLFFRSVDPNLTNSVLADFGSVTVTQSMLDNGTFLPREK